jgi:uncharacterized protein (TIGR00299 family) protein
MRRLPGKIAYLDCRSGVSGDMLLGAFCDANLPLETIKQGLAALPISGYDIQLSACADQGIRGSHIDVVADENQQESRHFADIAAMLYSSSLAPQVRDRAVAIFRTLGEAEAAIHGVKLEEIHFHEVGAIDSIVDIVGTVIALDALGITQLYASPLPFARGHQRMAHGLMPLPAPATLEILRRVNAPWLPCPIEAELVTPTGAAVLATLARFEMPAMTIEQVGYGFGTMRLIWPNCLRVCIGHTYP